MKTLKVRTRLTELSKEIKPLVESGKFESVNKGLLNNYQSEEHQEFKNKWQWRNEGKKIKEDAKPFPIWGKPRKRENKKTGEEYQFYPISFVYSNAQVNENQAQFGVSRFKIVAEPYPKVSTMKINSSEAAYKFLYPLYVNDLAVQEKFMILLLNRANNIIGFADISKGGISATVVDSRIVCKYAMHNLASGAIVAHNHPSGQLTPSEQDKRLTKKLKECLDIIDCQLLDHVILTENGHFSFADSGLI